MKSFKLAIAAALCLGGLSLPVAPAAAQTVRQDRTEVRQDRRELRRDRRHGRWNQVRGDRRELRNDQRRLNRARRTRAYWRHHTRRVCHWTWRYHHRVRTCRWVRW